MLSILLAFITLTLANGEPLDLTQEQISSLEPWIACREGAHTLVVMMNGRGYCVRETRTEIKEKKAE